METVFVNTENSKSNKFIYQFTDKLNIYYTWKNIKSTYNNNKFKISAPTWNGEFGLPDGSY